MSKSDVIAAAAAVRNHLAEKTGLIATAEEIHQLWCAWPAAAKLDMTYAAVALLETQGIVMRISIEGGEKWQLV